MGNFKKWEEKGLNDFFTHSTAHEVLACNVARSIAKNNVTSQIPVTEAINFILLHSPSIHVVLSKKLITKEILFYYSHKNKIPITNTTTKLDMIEKILFYWKTKYKKPDEEDVIIVSDTPNFDSMSSRNGRELHNSGVQLYSPLNNQSSEHFPINIMSRQFVSWFYNQLNDGKLTIDDFWNDASCFIRIIQNDTMNDTSCITNVDVLKKLLDIKNNFNFYFNPNVTHEGVQGRIDQYGLVFVLSCGSLHTPTSYVGIFESAFGLVRDPTTGNSWKMKHLKIQLKSTQIQMLPQLKDSDSLQNIIALPVTETDIQ